MCSTVPVSLLSPNQYFEYTSRKEIRFNSVTELCAEVPEGQTYIGMRHCPHDQDPRPPTVIWEFRDVSVGDILIITGTPYQTILKV